LENVIERAVALTPGPVIGAHNLPVELVLPDGIPDRLVESAGSLKDTLRRVEAHLVLRALDAAGWNCTRAAEALGLHPNTLAYRLELLGIKRSPALAR
jgi:DNA-binding NtrC family response regulator